MIIDFDVYGEKQVSRELLRFSGRATNAAPAFAMIADDMREIIDKQFETEGKRSSGGWAPLALSTIDSKARAGLDPRILHATLDLRRSLTEKDDSAHFEHITPVSLTLASQVEYGKYHQTGTLKMPRRRPVEFTEVDRQHFVKTLQRWIVEGKGEL